MEIFTLDTDITVVTILAKSFPDGVLEAHQKLRSLVPFSKERKFFGMSSPNGTGTIIYKAAAEELQKGELKQLGLPEFVIKKGKYLCIVIPDFMKNTPAIGNAFNELIHDPRKDPNGYCLEWYFNEKDLRCLVKLKED